MTSLGVDSLRPRQNQDLALLNIGTVARYGHGGLHSETARKRRKLGRFQVEPPISERLLLKYHVGRIFTRAASKQSPSMDSSFPCWQRGFSYPSEVR
jgi:hypothetical protein